MTEIMMSWPWYDRAVVGGLVGLAVYLVNRIIGEISASAKLRQSQHYELMSKLAELQSEASFSLSNVEKAIGAVMLSVQDVETNTRPPESQFPEYDT